LAETADLAAICDPNPLRMEYVASRLPRPVPQFTDFDAMIRQTPLDAVIVATKDCHHAEYAVKALRAGKRVYTEKPLCTTAGQCRQIMAAVKATGGVCRTTHNARYSATSLAIKSVLASGRLGPVKLMLFEESLDRCHGADYFRRWHRLKANTGGLQIHKASHHFDQLNWWAGSTPLRVSAQGGLRFYGRNNPYHGERCTGCEHAARCAFHTDLFASEEYHGLYRQAESADGYHRDGCVWDPSIDIEDQLGVHIDYANGIQVSYSLVAYSPIETQRIVIEGTKGRLESLSVYDTGWAVGKTRLPGVEKIASETVKLFLPAVGIEEVPLSRFEGEHDGADPQLRKDFFARDWGLQPNERMASLEDAVQAVLIGAAVNKSLATGAPVDVQDLLIRD
jgi:predicted dehydrogenase